MDQSTALHKLMEAAALIGMIEDLTNPATMEKLSTASLTGLRITLRTVKDSILNSHDTLAGELVAKARMRVESSSTNLLQQEIVKESTETVRSESVNALRSQLMADPERLQMRRKDLRASLESMADKGDS